MPLLENGAALFAGSADEFVRMAPASSLATHLAQEFNRRWGTTSESEIRSWRNSLTALAKVVDESGLQQSGVAIELRLPLTDRRIDSCLVARDGKGQPHVVLVEMKQWESAAPSMYPDNVVVGNRELLHPSVQAASYAAYLRDSHSAFTEQQFRLSPCAYIHNMPPAGGNAIRGTQYAGAIREAPFFVQGEEPTFGAFLSESLGGGDGFELLPPLVAGRYSPSKKLIDGIAKSLRESPVWTLLDEQRLAFNIVRGMVEKAVPRKEKAVIIVLGGPGTGKSVIAADLVVALASGGEYRVCHATGSKAFTTNLRAIGPRGAAAVFQYFNNFRHKNTEENGLDIIVCDEAHRIRETSNDRRTKKTLRSEISQVRELIRAARISVFLLDERQNVRPGEIGTYAAIEDGARLEGVPIRKIELAGQFRCNGCSPYIEWVDALLFDEPTKPGGWFAGGDYDLRIFDSVEKMEDAILSQVARENTGRLVAGFCWPWSDPRKDGSLAEDVQIGPWKRAWNEKSAEQCRPPRTQPPPNRHPYYLWATQPERIREIGCIYSAQGFEFDYCGVILGNDLVWRDGVRWVASKDASCDRAILNSRLEQKELKDLLCHTYRVLLTRGIKGTFVYSTDFDTREFLRSLLS